MERPKKYFISQFRSVDPFLADRYPPAGHRFTVGRSRAKRDAKASSAGGLLVRGSPNPAVEHVCNTTRTPASGEKHTRFHPERERESARSARHSPLNSRRECFSLSGSPFLCLGQRGGACPVPNTTRVQSASDPPLRGLECLFLSETRSSRSPTRARYGD